MALFGFEKDTLLDLTVNAIPLGILLFFIGAFAVVPAFGVDPVFSGMQFALMIMMFLLLAVLTYYAGKAIEGAESEGEAAELDEPGADTALDDDESPEDAAFDDESHDDTALGDESHDDTALGDESHDDTDELEEN